MEQAEVRVPVIVRLKGNNDEVASQVLREFAEQNADKMKLYVVSDFDGAAIKVTEEVQHQQPFD